MNIIFKYVAALVTKQVTLCLRERIHAAVKETSKEMQAAVSPKAVPESRLASPWTPGRTYRLQESPLLPHASQALGPAYPTRPTTSSRTLPDANKPLQVIISKKM